MRLEELIPNRKAKAVFDSIRRYGTVSKATLVSESGMTVSTLTRLLDELAASQLIEEVGFGASTGGRRPVLYRIHPHYGFIIGLDISRTSVKLQICDMQLQPHASQSWPMDRQMTPEHLLETTVSAIFKQLDAAGIPMEKVIGMGIGAVGPLNRNAGRIEHPRYFPAPGWEEVPICDMYRDRLNIPVLLDNGVNNALLGEYWAHGADEYTHQLYIHVGVGLRSAVMSDRKVVYGAVDMEGALGQMVIDIDGISAREAGGNYGALESYATTYALERSASAALKAGRDSVLTDLCADPDQIRFSMLTEALERGDALVRELFLQSATHFGTGLANLLNILHPEKVILGGPVITASDLYFDTAIEVARRKTYYYPKYQVVFSKGRLGEDAVCRGSAALVLNRISE